MLTPNQKLDKVLFELNRTNGTDSLLVEIYDLCKDFLRDFTQTSQILDKLVKDGFCRKEINNELDVNILGFQEFADIARFYITFEGDLFIQNGGYAQQAISYELEKTRVAKLEEEQRKTQSNLFWLTVWIAVATIVVGIQGLVWIVDYISTHVWCK